MNRKKTLIIAALLLLAVSAAFAGMAIELSASPYSYQGIITFRNREYSEYYGSKYGFALRCAAVYRFEGTFNLGLATDTLFCYYDEFGGGVYNIFNIQALMGFLVPMNERISMGMTAGFGLDMRTLNDQNATTISADLNTRFEYRTSEHMALSASLILRAGYEVGRGKVSINPVGGLFLGLTFLP